MESVKRIFGRWEKVYGREQSLQKWGWKKNITTWKGLLKRMQATKILN